MTSIFLFDKNQNYYLFIFFLTMHNVDECIKVCKIFITLCHSLKIEMFILFNVFLFPFAYHLTLVF